MRDFYIDCNNQADIAMITDYTSGGPSLNNSYSDIIIENYLVTGWQAHDNNDCYFERIAISNSFNNPNNPNSFNPTAALRSIAPGGPLQFINCNFLNEVYVAAQYISFVDCVTTGITLYGAFNVLGYVGGYAFPSTCNNNATIFVLPNGNAGNFPTEVGPITFTGSHIEINQGQFLVNSKVITQGTQSISGKLHFGVNAIGCHIHAAGVGGGSLISPVLSSTYFPFATSKFANCWFEQITLLEEIQSTTDPLGFFKIQYENCSKDSFYYNEPRYLNTQTGGIVHKYLGIPGFGNDINNAHNNFFKEGVDGTSYTQHNIIFQGHWGMGFHDNFGVTKGFIDFRLGKIDLKTGYFIDESPALTKDNAGYPNLNGLAEYPDNPAALSALGLGKLYHTGGIVKVTI